MKMTFDLGDSRNAAKLSVLLKSQVEKASEAVQLCEATAERFLFEGSRITREEYLSWAREDLAFFTTLRAQFDEQFAVTSDDHARLRHVRCVDDDRCRGTFGVV